MARNLVNHIITAERVQQLKQANEKGGLKKDDFDLLMQVNGIIPSAAAPMSETNFNNKEAVGSFIEHIEKTINEVD